MTSSTKPLPHFPPARIWVRVGRKLYNPLGFKHGYNFPLFIILVGALMGFVLARMQYLNIDGTFLLASVAPLHGNMAQ
jgi:hypothetical protein